MADNTVIKLETPVVDHDGPIDSLELKEPTYKEIMPLGLPYQIMGEGENRTLIIHNDALTKYVEKCVRPEGRISVLPRLSLNDTLAVRGAMIDFFLPQPKQGDG